jgi:hypothetical protein
MQRPTQVTRFAIGESSHVVSFGLEGRDVTILAEAAGQRLGSVVSTLPRFSFAWYHVPSRQIWSGTLDLDRNAFAGELVS